MSSKPLEVFVDPDRFEVVEDRKTHLLSAARLASLDGPFLELGVWKGESLRHLAENLPEKKFVGFDSFEGLPEDWLRSFDGKRRSLAGAFKLINPPTLPRNVELVVGYFEHSLLRWKAGNQDPVAFVHIDCDLYKSTKDALYLLNDQIVPGTILVFDELRDWEEQGVYERWREGEAKALFEWCGEFNRCVAPLYRTTWIEGSFRVEK